MFGFLNCNKPRGMSSRDVVNVVQRRLRSSPETKKVKVGHCGTLDPLAEGVLVLGIGPAVRLVPYVQQQAKRYLGRFRLGQSSPTGDLEIEPTRHDDLPIPSRSDLDCHAQKFIGQIEQTPPAYSAVWVDGQRAYQRVRRGEDVQMPSRKVKVESLRILEYEFPEMELDIVCGSGTYIRTLGMDLAKSVGSCCGDVVSATDIDRSLFTLPMPYRSSSFVTENLQTLLNPARLGVEHLPKLIVDETMSQEIDYGRCVDGNVEPDTGVDTDVAAITQEGELRAIMRWKRNQWCPDRVF